MNIERLEILADALEHFEERFWGLGFDTNVWWRRSGECGMTACVGGVACMIPEFQKLGLGLSNERNGCPQFGQLKGSCALKAFFDLSADQASMMFFPKRSLKPRDAAGHIRIMIAEASKT